MEVLNISSTYIYNAARLLGFFILMVMQTFSFLRKGFFFLQTSNFKIMKLSATLSFILILISSYGQVKTGRPTINRKNVGATEVQIDANTNTVLAYTPAPPIVKGDDINNTLSASHELGISQILVSENSGTYTDYLGTISVGNVARPAGYWRFKVRAATNRNESDVSLSPTFSGTSPPPVPIPTPTPTTPPSPVPAPTGSLFSPPIPTVGTNYYISNSGLATNSGLDSLHPWPPSKIQGGQASAIKTYNVNILFHSGEVFTGVVDISGYYGGTATDSTRYQSYGYGPRPILTTMSTVPNSNFIANWTLTSTPNVWKIVTNILTRPRVLLNGIEYGRAKTPELVTASNRTSWTNDVNGQFLYVYATSNPATFYSSITSSSFKNNTINIDGQGKIAIRHLDIRGGMGSVVDVAFTSGLIEDCIIGLESVGHGIRLNNLNGFVIRNNIFPTGRVTKGEFYIFGEGGGGDAIALYSYNILTNIEVYNNKFYDWVHSMLWIEQQGGANVTMSNIYFHDNFGTAPNLIYSRPFGAYGYLTANNIRVENNAFSNFTVYSQMACPGLFVRNNIFDSIYNTTDENHTYGVGYAINIGHFYYIGQNMSFSDNTFRNCEQGAIDIDGTFNIGDTLTKSPDLKNNVFNHNTFERNGTKAISPWYEPNRTPGGLDIMIRNRVIIKNNTWTNNIFKRNATDKNIFYGHDTSKVYLKTVAEFNAANGVAGDVISGNVVVAP